MSSRHTLGVLLLAALTSVSAQAASQIDQVQLNCSSALNIDGSSALSLRCDGDFSLIGVNGQGSIQADESLSFWASGALSFQGVLLSAPAISLSSDTSIAIDSDTRINGSTVSLESSPLTPRGGGTVGIGSGSSFSGDNVVSWPVGIVPVGSSVPEPSTVILSLTALMLSGLTKRLRSRSR